MTKREIQRPSLEDLNRELGRRDKTKRRRRAMRSTVWVLVVVAAAAILCSTFFLSVLEVQGSSMAPTLLPDQILLTAKQADFRRGDVVAFYYNNKILLKRVIAESGDKIDISQDGVVSVNGKELNEPYLTARSLGTCDIQLPEQIPDGRIFVLGDSRETSIDSRSSSIGCIAEKSVVGKVVLRIWPLSSFGGV